MDPRRWTPEVRLRVTWTDMVLEPFHVAKPRGKSEAQGTHHFLRGIHAFTTRLQSHSPPGFYFSFELGTYPIHPRS